MPLMNLEYRHEWQTIHAVAHINDFNQLMLNMKTRDL
jgi:hypothetical protein